jgi:hypothetical protein
VGAALSNKLLTLVHCVYMLLGRFLEVLSKKAQCGSFEVVGLFHYGSEVLVKV